MMSSDDGGLTFRSYPRRSCAWDRARPPSQAITRWWLRGSPLKIWKSGSECFAARAKPASRRRFGRTSATRANGGTIEQWLNVGAMATFSGPHPPYQFPIVQLGAGNPPASF